MAASEVFDLILDKDWEGCRKALLTATSNQICYMDKNNWTPLHLACNYEAPVDIMRALIEKGADIHARNSWENTPLHVAATYDTRGEVFHLLINAGSDVNAREYQGRNPLHIACSNKAPHVVIEILLHSGVDPLQKGLFVGTPYDEEDRDDIKALLKRAMDSKGA